MDYGKTLKYLDRIGKEGNKSFFTLHDVLTYNRPWNFITGPRSTGKTTATGTFLLTDACLNDHNFVYIRRDQKELDVTKQRFFDDAVYLINAKAVDFKIKDFKYDSGFYYIKAETEKRDDEDWVPCGCTIPLNLEHKYKSNIFLVYNGVYDEFMVQDSTKYLGTADNPTEYIKLLSLFTSLDRKPGVPFRNELKFFMLGNTSTIYNPIYMELGITKYIKPDSKVVAPKNKAWLLKQLFENDISALDGYQSSNVWKLSTEEQQNYNFRNTGNEDDTFIVTEQPKTKKFSINIRIDKKPYGVYSIEQDTKIFIGKGFCPNMGNTVSLDVQSHDGVCDKQFIQQYRNDMFFSNILRAYRNGKLWFDSMGTKMAFAKYLDFMP